MAVTVVRGAQVKDGTIQRVDVDVTTVGQSLIRKALGGTGISLVSTGADAGTGDVTFRETQPSFYFANTTPPTFGASDTYIPGSLITLPTTGLITSPSWYRCLFDMTKTAAGTAAVVLTIRMGTLGTTGDAAVYTLTFPPQTAVVDTAEFDVRFVVRLGGSSGFINAYAKLLKMSNATTGFTNIAAPVHILNSTAASGTINLDAVTKIGVSFNGGLAFSGTQALCTSEFHIV
jgi:hypothetical protein